MLVTTILRHFRVNLDGEYNIPTDGQNFEIGGLVLHHAGISVIGNNWYINEFGILGNRQKEDFDETEEIREPSQDTLPAHLQQLSLQILQMLDARFEQQRIFFEQRCEQMRSSLRREIASL
jgi:hypothetical protein